MLGANILLAYFHYCNKGIYPFSPECKDSDLRNLAQLDHEALSLVSNTREYAAHHSRSRPYMFVMQQATRTKGSAYCVHHTCRVLPREQSD